MKKNIKELLINEWLALTKIKNQKGILKKLALKYNVPEGTVRRWKSEHLKKKKTNVHTGKRTDAEHITERSIQIKKDILNNVPKEEVMEKYGIKKSKYYNEAKNIREIRIKKTEEYLEAVINEVYKNNIENVLKSGEKAKANLLLNSIKETSKENIDFKKISENEKAYNSLKKMLNDLMRTGKMVTPFELLEIEARLTDEELQYEKLEIEKTKIKKESERDNEKEKYMIDLLKNINKKVKQNE